MIQHNPTQVETKGETETKAQQQMWRWWQVRLAVAVKTPWYASYLLRRFYQLMQAIKPSKQLMVSTVTGAALLVGSVALHPASTQAATYTVNTTSDTDDGTCDTTHCSLREAIDDANANPGTDTIDLTGVSGTITLGSDLTTITDTVVLNGPGANRLTIDGGGANRTVYGTGVGTDVTVDGLTIIGSSSYGVNTSNDTTVTHSTISGNGGTGVNAGNDTMVTNSTISGNGGTGIYANNDITVTNSTVSGNVTGILAFNNLVVINSTVSGNGAIGVYARNEDVTIINSTITGQTPATGVSARDANSNGAVITLRNSLIVGNGAGSGDLFCNGALVSLVSNGFNLISDATNCAGLAGEVAGVPVTSILETTLADNGGETPTHALVPDSPALDAGNNADSPGATDQRGTGFERIINGTIDIGAFERQVVAAVGGLAEYIELSTEAHQEPDKSVFEAVSVSALISVIIAGLAMMLGWLGLQRLIKSE